MKLIIAEKPSVSQSIAAVLHVTKRRNGYLEGNGYIISWCAGHLLELAAPGAYSEKYTTWKYQDLPIIPAGWMHVASKDKAVQLEILAGLLKCPDVVCVINACDAGREGELIFRLVYEYAKSALPLERLWISSMEDEAIWEGFSNLKDGSLYNNLYAAASCRECADWLVGLNCTRLFSVLYGVTLNTGRVQSPTLAMLVNRETEIKNFIKTPFFTIELDCGNFTAVSNRFKEKVRAEHIAAYCKNAVITDIKQTEKTVAPPHLYDLTTLQREANRNHGYTAQQTLDYVQSLYEKKLSTYPRTDSRYLTDDMSDGVKTLVAAFAPGKPCNANQILNSAKVSDHHAIIPTIKSTNFDIATLPGGEHKILEMLINRLICAVGEKHCYLETDVILDVNSTQFKARGKTVIKNGWKGIEKQITDDGGEKMTALPELFIGQTFENVAAIIKEGATTPPKHYTEDTLLSSMENAGAEDMPDDAERKGLGTPATRAAIIEKLVKSGFIERSKKNLLPTDKGTNLIAVLPVALTSAKLTADWEYKLKQVERGELDSNRFMLDIAAFTKAIVLDNKEPKPEFKGLFPEIHKNNTSSLGVCPRCGSYVREGEKGFFCNNRTCGFKIWRNSKFWTSKRKTLTAGIVTALLRDGRVKLKDLYSEKTGKNYDATAILDDTGGEFVNFKLEFKKKRGN